MLRRIFEPLLTIVIAAVASVAFSSAAPAAAPQAPLGSYEISFYKNGPNGPEPVSSLQVCTESLCEELAIRAHIEDSSGLAAQGGRVTFEYCSFRGLPRNDITRADEAPSAACETSAASWARLLTLQVNESGDAWLGFGFVSIPRTIGFRIRYSGTRDIAKHTSLPADFTWGAASP